MREFFIGLVVVVVLLLLSVAGILLLPAIIVLGWFLKWVICLILFIFAIWLVGKITLLAIEHLKKKPNERTLNGMGQSGSK